MQIAVVGAGIIGLTAARRLAAGGHDVIAVAPVAEAHMASTGNAGTVAAYAVDPVGTPEVLRALPRLLLDAGSPLAIHRPSALALAPWLARFLRQCLPVAAARNRAVLADLLTGVSDDWRALAAEVGGTALLRERGALYAYDTPEAVAQARASLDRRRALGVPIEILDAGALQALEPGLAPGRFAGAALFPGTLWMTDPATMLARIAAPLAPHRHFARVIGLAPRGAGWRLTLDTGEGVDAEAVVLAASPEGIVLDRSIFYPAGGGQPGCVGLGFGVEQIGGAAADPGGREPGGVGQPCGAGGGRNRHRPGPRAGASARPRGAGRGT